MDPSKRILGGFWACIFAAFFIFGYIYMENLTQGMTNESTGVVTQVIRGRGGSVTVEHYVNNNRYVGRLGNFLHERLREGMQIRIYYDPADPRQLRSDNSAVFVFLCFFIFSFFLIGGLYAIKEGWRGRRELNGKPLIKEKPFNECTTEEMVARIYEWERERETNKSDFKREIKCLLPLFVIALILAVILQWLLH